MADVFGANDEIPSSVKRHRRVEDDRYCCRQGAGSRRQPDGRGAVSPQTPNNRHQTLLPTDVGVFFPPTAALAPALATAPKMRLRLRLPLRQPLPLLLSHRVSAAARWVTREQQWGRRLKSLGDSCALWNKKRQLKEREGFLLNLAAQIKVSLLHHTSVRLNFWVRLKNF